MYRKPPPVPADPPHACLILAGPFIGCLRSFLWLDGFLEPVDEGEVFSHRNSFPPVLEKAKPSGTCGRFFPGSGCMDRCVSVHRNRTESSLTFLHGRVCPNMQAIGVTLRSLACGQARLHKSAAPESAYSIMVAKTGGWLSHEGYGGSNKFSSTLAGACALPARARGWPV